MVSLKKQIEMTDPKLIWVENVINSCNSITQKPSCYNLVNIYYEQMPKNDKSVCHLYVKRSLLKKIDTKFKSLENAETCL